MLRQDLARSAFGCTRRRRRCAAAPRRARSALLQRRLVQHRDKSASSQSKQKAIVDPGPGAVDCRRTCTSQTLLCTKVQVADVGMVFTPRHAGAHAAAHAGGPAAPARLGVLQVSCGSPDGERWLLQPGAAVGRRVGVISFFAEVTHTACDLETADRGAGGRTRRGALSAASIRPTPQRARMARMEAPRSPRRRSLTLRHRPLW